MKHNFLAVFLLPVPQQEHREIVDVIRRVSDGDFKSAFVGAQCIAYVFASEVKPWDLGFGKVLMNNDSVLIVELGELYAQQNLRVAENWLAAHLPGRK